MPDNANSSQLPPAGVLPRIMAMVYDGMLLFALLCLATLVAVVVTGKLDPNIPEASSKVMHEADPLLGGLGFQVYLVMVVVGFYTLFWRKNGQTLGMQAWRIQVQASSGGKPGWGQCIVRCLTAIISMAPGFLGYWWVWIDRDNCSWHDRLSGTRV
ncbi:RDD family protein, partial [Litorivivens sp.]